MINGVNTLILITIAALLVEALIETFKLIAKCAKNDWKCIITQVMVIVIGIVVAVAYNLSLPAIFGLPLSKVPYISQILTGILISRGSNFVHDLYNRLQAAKLPIQLLGTIIPASTASTNVTMSTSTGQGSAAATSVSVATTKPDPDPDPVSVPIAATTPVIPAAVSVPVSVPPADPAIAQAAATAQAAVAAAQAAAQAAQANNNTTNNP